MPAHKKYHSDAEIKEAKRLASARWRARNQEQIRQSAAEYREKNREALRTKGRAYVAANSPTVAARTAAWRAANPERAREYSVQWAKRNPDLVIARAQRRRARLAGSEPDMTLDQWHELLEEFDHCCAYCQVRNVKLEQEHLTPIIRGGRHTKLNIVPACRSCNAKKGSKNLFEFASCY